MKSFVLSLSDLQADLATVGGKGMSLAKLTRAGLPVPDGFHVTTLAYREFVTSNGLQPLILNALEIVDPASPATLEAASQTISRLFAAASIPEEIKKAVQTSYENLRPWTVDRSLSSVTVHSLPSCVNVAVRSSATAEDLPGASFAGQQETYLNIQGSDAVLESVRRCWASLWTARAIAYRQRQGILPESVALAVVVQLLVPAGAAGILFTANPVTGSRSEIVINAAWGLGEAIVGGMVTPDTVTVDKSSGTVLRRETAEKGVMTVRTESGTEEQPVPDALKNKTVLDDAQAAELARLGVQIEELYGTPMDIEWTLESGKFAIVQARPITTLADAPIVWAPPDPKGIYMRASVVDLMPGPLSPLFVTTAIPALMTQMQPLGRRLTGADPVLHNDYYTSINNFAYMNASFPAKSWWWIMTSLIPMFIKTFGKLGLFWRDHLHPEYQAFVASRNDILPEQMSVSELWREAQEYVNASAGYVCGLLFATMGASGGAELMATQAYNKMAKREGDPDASALLMGWDNIPVRAEKSLYDLAMWARARAELAVYVLATPSDQLAEQLRNGQTPVNVHAEDWKGMGERFNEHLQKFGHIIFQLDFAEPLPLDNPAPMLENIKMYLRGEGTNPHERQKASEQKRVQTGETMLLRLKGFKRWAFTKALNYGQSMAAVREDALAEIGLGYPMLRRILHELGNRFVKAGVMEQASDIYLLEKKEIEALAGGADSRLAGLVAERKTRWDRLRKETPPPMMPMKKKYMGIDTSVWLAESEGNQTSNILKGVATSAGKVTAPACVLRGPEDFNKMRRGDVLVAGTTTPAWTPLFAMASAVVTDIGGPLSHGSIVAREYGIPAVMGTGIATRRVQNGQIITVDGSEGTVTLLLDISPNV